MNEGNLMLNDSKYFKYYGLYIFNCIFFIFVYILCLGVFIFLIYLEIKVYLLLLIMV